MALRIKDNVDLKELEKYIEPVCHTCFVDDTLNTYEYKLKYCNEFVQITNKKIHKGNENCKWLENIYDLIKANLVEKVEDK